jgi:hypothetical protein
METGASSGYAGVPGISHFYALKAQSEWLPGQMSESAVLYDVVSVAPWCPDSRDCY